MLGKLLAVLFAAIVVIASVVVTSIGPAAQTPIKVAFIGDLGVNSAFTHKGIFFIPSGVGIISHNADDANHIAYTEAVSWLRKAAEQGDATSQYHLGFAYNVPQDNAEAVKWYSLAAEKGQANAQTNLGLMYANGEGVTQDYVQAHKWYNIAVINGEGIGRQEKDNIEKLMTPDQIAEAQRLAIEWMEKYEKK